MSWPAYGNAFRGGLAEVVAKVASTLGSMTTKVFARRRRRR